MIIEQLKEYKGEAIIDLKGTYSFNDLTDQIEKYDQSLNLHIEKGDVIVIDSDYSFNSIALLLSLSKLPVIIIPIVRTTEQEFNDKITASEPNIILTINSDNSLNIKELKSTKSQYDKYTEIINANNCGIVLFSSGTTGIPKVMVHNFDTLISSFKKPRRQRSLKFLLFLLFDHIGGLNTLLSCLNNGSPVVLPENRSPGDILNLIEKHKIQLLPTSPTFLNLILMDPSFGERDLSSLKMITYGTEKMPSELLKKLNKAIPTVKFLQTFGTSETGILKTQSKSSSSLYFKIIDDEVEHKIENNQLYIKSKTSVKEYKGVQSDQFQDDGWFATGDLVDQDDEGYIRVVGRIKEVINVGGLKVLPVEVEDVINTIEGIVDCTVFSKENAITGQMVCVNIVLEGGIDPKSIKSTIKTICKEKLDKYKRPAKITIQDKLGHTSRFKKKI